MRQRLDKLDSGPLVKSELSLACLSHDAGLLYVQHPPKRQ